MKLHNVFKNKKIEKLQSELTTQNKHLAEIEKRIWILENPPKFNVNDKIGKYIVVKETVRELSNYWFTPIFSSFIRGESENVDSQQNKIDLCREYEVINTKTKKIETALESELERHKK